MRERVCFERERKKIRFDIQQHIFYSPIVLFDKKKRMVRRSTIVFTNLTGER